MTASVHYPNSQEGRRFCEFFNHRFSFIVASLDGSGKPDWKTITDYPLEHRNLWNRFLDPDTLVGLSFGPTAHYLLADIDRGSPYHPYNDETAFKRLLFCFEDVGFNAYLILQSSWSEGIHVYFPLPENVPTFKLALLAKQVAIRSGFAVKDGILEFFPNAKPYNKERPTSYKAHRLPLQEGSFLLDRDYQPYTDAVSTFLDQAEACAVAQDISDIKMAMEAAYHTRGFNSVRGDASRAAAFARDLQEQIAEGWTDFGQTNDLLRIIGTYGRVFEGLGGRDLARYIAATAQRLPGYAEFCRHQHHIERRAAEWARCIEKFYYPYGTQPGRAGTFAEMLEEGTRENQVNNERQQGAISRIKRGVEFLQETLQYLPRRVGEMKDALVNTISHLFGVRPSDKTLYRYQDLWHPSTFITEVEVVMVSETLEIPVTEPAEREVVILPEIPEAAAKEPAGVQQLEPAPGEQLSPCPTPTDRLPEDRLEGSGANPLLEAHFAESATPSLYMKVLFWASGQERLIYRGNSVHGTVDIEGEKRLKVQSIDPNQEVTIVDYTHSSFLFHPDKEDNLQVYVKPIDCAEHWLSGIPVLAKYLQFCLDG